ncbi:lytic transglycosylase domain-containing protein [Aminobacter sp. MDW-2]|uniref:lytic transglycosylase domain-containing protein n=1 Tax=Aminobacter sp. MDW-2 TaxID=2666139 RepID=UPI0012AF7C86|nr:lytic transglycosylase domain-containing protein [Aminobacter sp. MDW-2]MRX36886.1 transglycosylase SLT domain-containing protein [Aminobacter sp. MDW-2]QNH37911.1 lytic transglycosylase domain-containing protein [Aminobacter sp. MDW-2]
MIKRLSLILVFTASPAFADIPTIDGTVLDERQDRDKKTAEIEKVDEERYVNNQSVTCSMHRPGRKDDPVAAANANPAIAGLVRRIAREQGVDENQFLALVYQESRFNPCAKSPAGAIGLAQLMPSTAGDLSVDPYNIEQNLRGGARYYKQQLRKYNGNVSLALAAYNAGAGNVNKYGGIPPFKETQGYVANITQKWLPALGGSDKSGIPLNYGGGGTYAGARTSTINAMGLTAAIGEGSGDVSSWLTQLGDMGAGTIQDSWDHNSGTRNANIELINRLILLSTAFADLTNSSNAMTLGDLSGANRSTRYDAGNEDDDRPVGGFCDEREGFVWDADAKACVQRINAQAELLLETQ